MVLRLTQRIGTYQGKSIMDSSRSSLGEYSITYYSTYVAQRDLHVLISSTQPTSDYLKDLDMESNFNPSLFKDGLVIEGESTIDIPFLCVDKEVV